MYLKMVAIAIGIFLLSCVVLPNLISETDEGSTYKEPANNPDLNAGIGAEEQAIRDLEDWLKNTPEGQELLREADRNPSILQYYPRWQNEGETHEQSLQSWRGAPRRIVRDIKQVPRKIENVLYNPLGGFEQHYARRLEDAGITSHVGAVGLVGFDIVWGMFHAIAQRN